MERPNLLLFMPDQLRADALSAFGNPVAHTPHIDALAADGVRFTNAYGQHSVCTQSWISMFTGWYPHVAGHRSLDDLFELGRGTWLAVLSRPTSRRSSAPDCTAGCSRRATWSTAGATRASTTACAAPSSGRGRSKGPRPRRP